MLCMISVFPSHATATSSNIELETEDIIIDEYEDIETIEYISPVSRSLARAVSSVPTITNTINYDGAYIELAYYDMSSVLHYTRFKVDSSGAFAFTKPDDYVKPQYLSIYLMAKSLPTSGSYKVMSTYKSNTGVTFSGSPWVHTSKAYNNANSASATFTLDNYIYDLYGDAYTEFTVKLGSGNLSYFQIKMPCSEVSFQANGNIRVSFTRVSADTQVDGSSAGSDTYTSENASIDTATNTAEIASGVADVNDSLKEIIQTISNQLEALWDQMYNYIHLEDMANADKNANNIINNQDENTNQLIENQDENTQDIIDSLGDNTTSIIQNNNENTNTIVNGYDSSSLDNSSNQLNDTLTQYDDIENSISESMGVYFDNFEYDNISGYPTGVLSSLLFFGNYLQSIFESIGNFNLPITLGLTLTFVLMLIGYFRYGR